MKRLFALATGAILVALTATSSATGEAPPADPTVFGSQGLVLEVDPLAPTGPPNAECNGPAGPGPYHNIVVKAGDNCYLNGTTVTGNVSVQAGGGLRADGANIDGDLNSKGANYIAVGFPGSSVGGNIKVLSTTGTPGVFAPGAATNYICRTTVGGNLQVEQSLSTAPFNVGANTGPPAGPPPSFSTCSFGNTVGGNVEASKNAGQIWISDNFLFVTTEPGGIAGNLEAGGNTGGVHIYMNQIGGNLKCDSNNPPPDGAGNVVQGNEQGQCTGF
jgi:hypothetical protein